MFDLIIGALLPIAVILILGYFAGGHKDFTKDQASVLNKMVMMYALPLCLFAGIVKSSLDELIAQKSLILGLFLGMIVTFFIIVIIVRYVFKQNIKTAALLAMSIAGPAIPFVGIPVLGDLYGPISTVPVSIGSLYMNLIQLPVAMILLSIGNADSTNSNISKRKFFFKNVIHAVTQPVVWAPILAFILVLCRVHFPQCLISSFDLLGKATGGVALFASGIILFSYKITFNWTVIISVLIKNLGIPFLLWGVCLLFGSVFSAANLKETIHCVAIPTASIGTILAIEYNSDQRNVA